MYTKTLARAIFVLGFASLPLLGGCVGGGNPDTDPNGETDSDTDVDTDVDADFEAEIQIPVPDYVPNGASIEVDNEIVATTGEDTRVYSYIAAQPGFFHIGLVAPNYRFVDEVVDITEEDVGETFVVSWGDGDGGLAPDGDYFDPTDGEPWEVWTETYDLDDDGDEEVVLEGMNSWGISFSITGNSFEGDDSHGQFADNGGSYGFGTIEDDLSAIYLTLIFEDGQEIVKTLTLE